MHKYFSKIIQIYQPVNNTNLKTLIFEKVY